MENKTLTFLEKENHETGYLVFDSSDNMVFESTDKQSAIRFCNELCYGALVCESSDDPKMGMAVVYEKREETETMNTKSKMLYESGSQSEDSGQMGLGLVAIAIGAAAIAYGVYKVAEPLTTMLP